jgi:hypothetical protein
VKKPKRRCKDTVNLYPNHEDTCGVCQELDELHREQNRAYKIKKQKGIEYGK